MPHAYLRTGNSARPRELAEPQFVRRAISTRCYPVVMDSPRGPRSTTGHFHAVRFYENKASLARTVSDFLAEGFVAGQPALMIATPEHRDSVLLELRARHVDVDKAE